MVATLGHNVDVMGSKGLVTVSVRRTVLPKILVYKLLHWVFQIWTLLSMVGGQKSKYHRSEKKLMRILFHRLQRDDDGAFK